MKKNKIFLVLYCLLPHYLFASPSTEQARKVINDILNEMNNIDDVTKSALVGKGIDPIKTEAKFNKYIQEAK